MAATGVIAVLVASVAVGGTVTLTRRAADGRPVPGAAVAAAPTPSTSDVVTPPSSSISAPGVASPSTTHAAPTPFTPLPVAPLHGLAAPDAWVTLRVPLTALGLAAVKRIPAVTEATPVSTGSVVLAGVTEPAVGVDPSAFRRVTPRPTAASDALWASIAAGDLATELTHDALPSTLLGHSVAVRGRGTRQVRLGALAAFGLPEADVVMSLSRGEQLGLRAMTGLIVSAPTVSPATLVRELADATGGHVDLLGPDAAEADIAGGSNAKGLPLTWSGLFQQAASSCSGLSWTILAAIGQIESGDGQNDGPSSKGAIGPMQFLPATFAEYAVDGDHDGKTSALDAYDAVPTAARMLCHDGAGEGPAQLKAAIFAYNHAREYVDEVLALAARYR